MSETASDFHQFVTALMAHDISNFNQTTRGYLEMLAEERMGPLTDEQYRVIQICLRQSVRIQSLIESIRLLEMLNSKPPAPKPVDLDEAIRSAIDFIQTSNPDREIRVRFTPARRLAMVEPEVDSLFEHLLSNAVRHNDAEIVEVDITIRERAEPQPAWDIRVSDNGEGLPVSKIPKLFDRLDNRDLHGHGLGLSLIKQLVTRWGGEIGVETTSETEQGAVFSLSLPKA